jgi:quercetin dioxygenase-like cupin family protein
MRLIHEDQVEPEAVQADEHGNPAEGTFLQVLIPDGPNFVLRVFTVKPGGHTPSHSHAREHEVYVLSGQGTAEGEQRLDLTVGDAVYVPPGEPHSFVNTGEEDFRFVCVVPREAACR